MHCSIIPPYLLRRLAAPGRDPEFSAAARAAKEALQPRPGRSRRPAPCPGPVSSPRDCGSPSRARRNGRVYDAKVAEQLPGSSSAKKGEPASGDRCR